MPNLTKEVFDATASTYDRDRAKLIPGSDAFYRWAIDLIPSGAKTIVDLGAGSGLLTQLVRPQAPRRRPEPHLHASRLRHRADSHQCLRGRLLALHPSPG